MEKDFISEENFILILKALKFNGKEYIDLKKGQSIIKLVKSNDKFNKFLISQFLENYIKHIYEHRADIMEYTAETTISDFQDNDFYIHITKEEFLKLIQRIAIDGEHLSEEEIEKAMQAFNKVKSNKKLDNLISYKFIKDYVLYVYENRYQIRKHLSKKINKLKRDKEGDYLIDDSYIVRDNNDGGKNSPFWISIERHEDEVVKGDITKDIVVKNMFDENKKETALIAEEIARQLRLPVAQYYPAKYVGTKYTTQGKRSFDDNKPYVSKRIVITPNFLEDGEELITGDRIAGYEMDVSRVPNIIREYLSKEGLEKQEIDDLVSDYRTIMAFNCFINHRDCHNGNWGYIKQANGKFKIAHIFDLEGSLLENIHHIRAIYVGDYMEDDKILYELLKDKKTRKKVASFLDLDMEQVFLNVYVSKGFIVPNDMKVETQKLIGEQKCILQNVIKQIDKDEKREYEKIKVNGKNVKGESIKEKLEIDK